MQSDLALNDSSSSDGQRFLLVACSGFNIPQRLNSPEWRTYHSTTASNQTRYIRTIIEYEPRLDHDVTH